MADQPLTAIYAFQSLRQFIGESYGADAWSKLEAELRARHDVALPADWSPGSWHPTHTLITALNCARDLFGPADLHERFGRAGAEYEVSWVHRVVLRFASPLWLLERGSDYWKRQHDTGRWEIEGRQGWLRGTLHDFGVVDAGYCDVVRSWLWRASVMTGAAKVFIVERQCRARGGAACVFEGTW